MGKLKVDGYCIIVPLRSDLKNSNEENPLNGYKSVYVPRHPLCWNTSGKNIHELTGSGERLDLLVRVIKRRKT